MCPSRFASQKRFVFFLLAIDAKNTPLESLSASYLAKVSAANTRDVVSRTLCHALLRIYMYTYISSSSSSRFFLLKVFFFVSSSFFLRSLVDFLSLSFVFHFIFFFSSFKLHTCKVIYIYIKREEQKCKAQQHSPPPPRRRERRRARSPPGALVVRIRRRGILRTPASSPA